MPSELKPCPGCGSVEWLAPRKRGRRVAIACMGDDGCGWQGPEFVGDNAEDAARRWWNTRSPSPESSPPGEARKVSVTCGGCSSEYRRDLFDSCPVCHANPQPFDWCDVRCKSEVAPDGSFEHSHAFGCPNANRTANAAPAGKEPG